MAQIKDFEIFSFTRNGGCYKGALDIFESLLQGGFSIAQWVVIIVSAIVMIWSASCLIIYSRKPKELVEHVELFGENSIVVVFLVGLIGIITAVTQL